MVRQKELAFISAISNVDLSPVILRGLRKTVAAGKKKAVESSKANATSASALERLSRVASEALTSRDQSRVASEALTSRDSPQLPVRETKAKRTFQLRLPSELASRRPAPGHLFSDGPTAQGNTGELAAQSSRKVGSTEGGMAYAAVVDGRAGPQQPSGQHKPPTRVQITLNLLPHLRQPLGAFLSETCPGLCVACLMAPL